MRIQKIEVMVATPDDGEPLDIGILQSYLRLQTGKAIEVLEVLSMDAGNSGYTMNCYYKNCCNSCFRSAD